jgi:hypothetical protein
MKVISKYPPHLNPLPPGERKIKRNWGGWDEGEIDMPWHIATLIKEWAQYIEPLCFFNSFVGA